MGSNRERMRLGEEIERMEREDREVAEAARSYERMSRRVREESGGLRQDELARIYDLSVPVEEVLEPRRGREILSPPPPARPSAEESPGQS